MTSVKVTNFGGILPGVAERALPPANATRANNLVPGVTEFRPLLGATFLEGVLPVSNPKTVFRFRTGVWRAYTNWTNLVRWPSNDNNDERTSVTDGAGAVAPRVIDNTGADRLLGVPSPVKPILTLNAGTYFTEENRANAVTTLRANIVAAIRANMDRLKVGAVYLGEAFPGFLESGPEVSPDPNVTPSPNRFRSFRFDAQNGTLTDAYVTGLAEDDVRWVTRTNAGNWVQSVADDPAWRDPVGTWHYDIAYQAYAPGWSVDTAAAIIAVDAVEFVDTTQASEIVARAAQLFDKTGPTVAPMVAELAAAVQRLELVLQTRPAGAMPPAEVTAQINSILDAAAQQIWTAINQNAQLAPFFNTGEGP